VCTVIAKNTVYQPHSIGNTCGGLAWERTYKSNDKYICWGDNSWPCTGTSWNYCPYWSCVSWASWQKAESSVLLQKGVAASNCSLGTCNPINFTILKPSDWEGGLNIGIMIDGKGLDPRTTLYLKLVTVTHESSSYQVFHSF
jgi:hypothetical protein